MFDKINKIKKINKINKKIKILQNRYNKWEKNADWNIHAIEVNPHYHNLKVLINYKDELLQEYLLTNIIQSV